MYYFVLKHKDGSTELLATTETQILTGLGAFDPKTPKPLAPYVVQLDAIEYDRLGLSTPSAPKPQAVNILRGAAAAIDNRASQRERSMAKAVAAFNALYGHNLSEVEGWQFMSLLKKSRASQGCFVLDDYLDDAAYCALAGEAAGL